MATTPYDEKILLVHWMGRTSPQNSIVALADEIRKKMPNVGGVMVKTSNGVSWQGHLGDEGPQAITGVRRIARWVEVFGKRGLDVHVWGVPRAKRGQPGATRSPDIEKEAARFATAANVEGVKSLLLDVEHGEYYWQGTPEEARELMERIRNKVGEDTHIGMILDGRRNRRFEFYVDPWIPFVDSLHPMAYPVLFGLGNGRTIGTHLDTIFNNLTGYGLPIVPMLQAFAEAGTRPTPSQVTEQGNAAWARGAAGLSFFRLGSDRWSGDNKPHMGAAEYKAIRAIASPRPEEPTTYTWQNVINAAVVVALENDASWDKWMRDAGCWRVFHNALRQQPYNGPPLQTWPIAAELQQRIHELAQEKPAVLARLTTQAQEKAEKRQRVEVVKKKERPAAVGSIVGIHGAPGIAAPPAQHWDTWINHLKEMGVRWYKQCDNGDPGDLGPHSIFGWVTRLKQEGIEPIIRFLVSEQFPDALPDHHFEKMRRYSERGVVWAEIGNEPNLDLEWKSSWHNRDNAQPMQHGNPEAIRIIAETWVRDARRTLETGMRPGFYAFAPTDWRGNFHPLYSSVHFTRKVVAYLAQHRKAETVAIFNEGGWIAVHAATYEQPVAFNPNRPDGSTWDMTLRSYEVVLDAFQAHFGAAFDRNRIPVMSTEGGVFTPESTSMGGHRRLATEAEHAQRVVEMFRWLEQHSPLQAMCPWCLSVGNIIGHYHEPFRFDGYIEEVNGSLRPRAVYEAMRQMRFDNERTGERFDDDHESTRLNVPYISQFDPTASLYNSDCGPTCVAMLLNIGRDASRFTTVDDLYRRYLSDRNGGFTGITGINDLRNMARGEGLENDFQRFNSRSEALAGARRLIEAGTPFIALVDYTPWADITGWNYRDGHFVVVTGCDDDHIFVHDPIFRGGRRDEGRYFVWRNERFLDGWGSPGPRNNHPFQAVVPRR